MALYSKHITLKRNLAWLAQGEEGCYVFAIDK
jgi:hypothetical protein